MNNKNMLDLFNALYKLIEKKGFILSYNLSVREFTFRYSTVRDSYYEIVTISNMKIDSLTGDFPSGNLSKHIDVGLMQLSLDVAKFVRDFKVDRKQIKKEVTVRRFSTAIEKAFAEIRYPDVEMEPESKLFDRFITKDLLNIPFRFSCGTPLAVQVNLDDEGELHLLAIDGGVGIFGVEGAIQNAVKN